MVFFIFLKNPPKTNDLLFIDVKYLVLVFCWEGITFSRVSVLKIASSPINKIFIKINYLKLFQEVVSLTVSLLFCECAFVNHMS